MRFEPTVGIGGSLSATNVQKAIEQLGLSGGGRTKILTPTDFFVATPGSGGDDGNPGTIGAPWATLQHALTVLGTLYDFGGNLATVNVGAGSFAGFGFVPCVGGGIIQVQGNGSGSTTITDGPNDGTYNVGDCVDVNFASDTGLFVDGVTFAPSSLSSAFVLSASNFNCGLGQFGTGVGDQVFIIPAGGNTAAMIGLFAPCQFTHQGIFTINGTSGGGYSSFYEVDAASRLLLSFPTGTVTGAPVFQHGFVNAVGGGTVVVDHGSFVGSTPTGPRFIIGSAGRIVRANILNPALGPNYFPGNTAGTCTADGVYDNTPGPISGISLISGPSYTLGFTDIDGVVEMNNAGANTVTVPPEATTNFLIGTRIKIVQVGAGATTIAAGVGVTVHNAGALSGQWGSAFLYKRASDEWVQTT